MSTNYVAFSFEDPDDFERLTESAFSYFAAKLPGWLPAPGDPLTILIESTARMAAELKLLAGRVPEAVFRYFGASLLGLAPIEASHASVGSTWAMVDLAGHTIPAGTLVGLPADGDRLIAFEVAEDVVVPPGSGGTGTGEVLLVAREPGAAGSGLHGAPATLLTPLSFVDWVATPGYSTGGVDAESDADYRDRLAAELQLLSPRPILAGDFAVMARRVAGVERAVAIDGYDPGTNSTGNERMVTVAVVDAAGEPTTTLIKTAVDGLLQAEREVNFVVHVIDPTYTSVNVTFLAHALPDYDPADVQARAVQAVTDYLSPANWGLTVNDGGWRNQTRVRYLEVAAMLDRVEGLDYIDQLWVQGVGTDLTLTGAIPLPRPGAISGSVAAAL